jgi:hypothetical protein
MALSIWVRFLGSVSAGTREGFLALLRSSDIDATTPTGPVEGFGAAVFEHAGAAVLEGLRACATGSTILAVCIGRVRPSLAELWAISRAGARDTLVWPHLPADAEQVVARLERWAAIEEMADYPAVKDVLVGTSPRWRTMVRSVVEVAAFSQASVLVVGESGTGKELIARLVHDLDQRPRKGEFVVVDCTTIVADLSGSELFGHERGAFTGAVGARDGAFALADGGTLFLDEIGELPLPLQAQLLRAVQEHTYKRVGSNTWQPTDFRLVCATNRDLSAAVATGQFRADRAGCADRRHCASARRTSCTSPATSSPSSMTPSPLSTSMLPCASTCSCATIPATSGIFAASWHRCICATPGPARLPSVMCPKKSDLQRKSPTSTGAVAVSRARSARPSSWASA